MWTHRTRALDDAAGSDTTIAPGKATLTSRIQRQARGRPPAPAAEGPALADHEDPFAMHLLGDGAALPGRLRGELESSAGADLSAVRVHTDGGAADRAGALDAHAYALGQDIHFAAGAYDPASAAGRHLIAHEVAHTVQQGAAAADPQCRTVDVSAPGDAGEREADAFADAFTAGRPAPSLSAGAPRVARFSAGEHKYLGDQGSGGQVYDLPGGTQLTHGDLVMLSGDHFSPTEVISLARVRSLAPGNQLASQDALICALKWKQPDDQRFAKGGVWHGLEFSDEVQAFVERRYNALASDNMDHFLSPDGGPGPTPSAASTYRELHSAALSTAYGEGRRGAALQSGMMIEACAQHFLTDAFSSGHVATARAAARAHWDERYKDFVAQFIEKMSEAIAVELDAEASNLGANLIPFLWLQDGAAKLIKEKMDGKPAPSIGGIVALIGHDHDNDNGLWLTNDLGWSWFAAGDGKLDMMHIKSAYTSKHVAETAVRLGCDDIRHAHALGVEQGDKPALDEGALYEAVWALTAEPAAKGVSSYGAEQLMPRLDPTHDQGEQGWNVSSLEELWEARVRSNHEATYGEGIVEEVAADGDIGKELDAMRDGIPEYQDVIGDETGREIPLHGYIQPRKAFIKGVLEPLRDTSGCRDFFLDIVNRTVHFVPVPGGLPEPVPEGGPHDAGVP